MQVCSDYCGRAYGWCLHHSGGLALGLDILTPLHLCCSEYCYKWGFQFCFSYFFWSPSKPTKSDTFFIKCLLYFEIFKYLRRLPTILAHKWFWRLDPQWTSHCFKVQTHARFFLKFLCGVDSYVRESKKELKKSEHCWPATTSWRKQGGHPHPNAPLAPVAEAELPPNGRRGARPPPMTAWPPQYQILATPLPVLLTVCVISLQVYSSELIAKILVDQVNNNFRYTLTIGSAFSS